MKNKKTSPWKSIQVGLAALLVLFIYAYGFDVTKVNLEELRSERRQESLTRVTRALAQPDIITYDQEEVVINSPLYVPCPSSALLSTLPTPDTSTGYVVIEPACANPGEAVQVEGFNFTPNTTGPIRFVPGNDPLNLVALGRESIDTDDDGHFITSFVLPERLSDDPQFIRVTISQNVGAPRFSQVAIDTWGLIIETVFMALLATTLGTILAFPLSFIAARNLMKSVRSPLTSVALSVLGWPIGMGLGYYIVNQIGLFTIPLSENPWVSLVSVLVVPIVFWFALRWALPQEDIIPTPSMRFIRILVLFIAILIAFYGFFQLAGLATILSLSIEEGLGSWGFLANFLFQVSDILRITTPALGALAAGGAFASFLGGIGQRIAEKGSAGSVKAINFIVAAMAGATIFGLFGWLVEWLYEIGRIEYTFWIPILAGAGLGLILAAFTQPKDTLPTGMVIYSITRTILNGLRSVEALVMAIVFVIAVGIGPFAGMMALGLHTIVSLAKLYSEQVESIMPGPLEAITATGANRLQTIIYAVIPQIIPPYISYTMYRWDINVRMSTIIGFVGGGGIGFLLQQNINLLNYRAASTQMLAIAIVVASMDYLSSWLRERVI
jgi:phosphonate ABC transporter permease subunit PhnE